MALQTKKSVIFTLLANACRLLLSLVLIVSGFVKAVDPVGFTYKLQEYAAAFSSDVFSDDWLLFFAIIQAMLEFLLGVFMLMGVYRKFISVFVFAMMLVFTLFTSYIYIASPVDDCGCFGEAFIFSNGATLAKNIILLLFSTVVFLGRRRFVWYITSKSRWMVVIYSLFYICLVEGLSLSSLPVLDFRPYAVGNNLREMAKSVPEVYEVKLVYEKDGEKREFTQDNAPDSSWVFVESRTELVKEGSEALIGDFAIVDWQTDEDIAAQVLADTGYVYLVAIEFMEKASVSRVDKVNDLYDYCVENGIPFYAMTSSGEEEIDLWRRRTGAEYPIYWSGNTMLRTMVRSNPGVVLLNNGVVVGKWNSESIPDIENLSVSPAETSDKLGKSVVGMHGWGFWTLVLCLPLLLIVLIDALVARAGRKKPKNEPAETDKELQNKTSDK